MGMTDFRGRLDGSGKRFALVASRFNELVTERLVAGARSCFTQHGVAEDDLDLIWVPGAWELPLGARGALRRGGYDGIVALGCVIRGETPHFDYVAGGAASGLATIGLEAEIPVGLGLLTTDTAEQALARAGGKSGNKGWEAALSVLEMAGLLDILGEDRARA
jgi:6,7-dimethyl-8-ribityllumazine synthase